MEIEKRIFIFNKLRVFFKHTDYYGFLHPYNFLEWTSYVREAFFLEKCGDHQVVIDSSIKMMTAKIAAKQFSESIFGDDIEARFTTSKIKKISFEVIIRFFNKRLQRVVCETRHTLVFVDSISESFISIPSGIKNAVMYYQETEASG